MKSEFLLAITQLSAEKSLPKEVVITAIEAALVSAYRKESFAPDQNISVKINPNSGRVEVWAEKTVVEEPSDPHQEISLQDARKLKKDTQVGETLMVESTPSNAGRIAAQTAKQVILQRLHEAEHSAIFEEYANREGDAITAMVQRIEVGQVYFDLGRTEAVMPPSEQVRTERYRAGQRLKVLILQAARTSKGAKVIVSRSHPELLKRLFELEVPEVFNGSVEIKSIAREAGFRSKVAVAARQEGIDPVGCCVGLRGIRIQNIVNELSGEKIDVVMWHPDYAVYIANALSPAHIVTVSLSQEDKIATVVVPDKQLSLAIGKEGQNARLAAKLTGWRIDIKSASATETEKLVSARAAAEQVAEKVKEETPPQPAPIPVTAQAEPAPVLATVESPAVEPTPTPVTEPVKELEPETAVEEPVEVAANVAQPIKEAIPAHFLAPRGAQDRSQIRFAEDIMASRGDKSDKKKRKKKAGVGRDTEEGLKVKHNKREYDFSQDDEL